MRLYHEPEFTEKLILGLLSAPELVMYMLPLQRKYPQAFVTKLNKKNVIMIIIIIIIIIIITTIIIIIIIINNNNNNNNNYYYYDYYYYYYYYSTNKLAGQT